jgi:hypothetical protein
MREKSYQFRPRGVGVRLEVLHDVSVASPVVNESEFECRRVNTVKWQNIIVNQSFPDGHRLPKDLLRFPEVLWRIDAEGLEGDVLVVPKPSPDIGGSTRCHWDTSAFLESLERSDGIGE